MTDTSEPRFDALGLSPQILKALQDVGYEQPSPIQAESIPHLLQGRDLLGLAQTGTGKTAAFALPMLNQIDAKLNEPQILVLAPTRELAIQVAEAFQRYAKYLKNFHVMPIYGGQDMRTQLKQLSRGAQVVVGTPGRVMDHLRRGSLNLKSLKGVVLDEADEMLRMGFIDDVTWILDQTPKTKQVALFSATMPKQIKDITKRYLSNPKEVHIKSETKTVENIEQIYWLIQGTNKVDALTRLLDVEPFTAILIFVRTKTATAELAEKLVARGYSAAAMNGDMSQQLRERVIEQLKNERLDIVIATDVAARGIDVSRISHVINYDIPYDAEAYVHRIGRTGRAGRTGKAILFITNRERRLLRSIENMTGKEIKSMPIPSLKQVANQRIELFKQQLGTIRQEQDLTPYSEIIQGWLEDEAIDIETLASALLYLAQADKPLIVTGKDRVEPEGDRSRGRNDDDGPRPKRDKKPREDNGDFVTYKIAVGSTHGVKPGNIVGAIANEAGIASEYIGPIKIHEDYSTVNLPGGMPREVYMHLKEVWVCGQKLHIEPLSPKDPRPGRKPTLSKPPRKMKDGPATDKKPRKPKANSGKPPFNKGAAKSGKPKKAKD